MYLTQRIVLLEAYVVTWLSASVIVVMLPRGVSLLGETASYP